MNDTGDPIAVTVPSTYVNGLEIRCDQLEETIAKFYAERSNLRAEVKQLQGLVTELTDSAECWYDHHGYCQTHTGAERPCPHERAKALGEINQGRFPVGECAPAPVTTPP